LESTKISSWRIVENFVTTVDPIWSYMCNLQEMDLFPHEQSEGLAVDKGYAHCNLESKRSTNDQIFTLR